MNKKKLIFWMLPTAILFLTFCNSQEPDPSGEKPNIVLIMSDDMGYSDLGCYGGEIETPSLDRLAGGGLRFTHFYNTARCCPTRASLMTGLHPHQTGIGHMTNTPEDFQWHDLGIPSYRGFLNRNCVTIAEVLQQAGYVTLMTGKWHLGISEREKWPLQRGFDRFYGIISGACNFFQPIHPRGITDGNDTITITDPDFYTTDAFTDRAIGFIHESRKYSRKPFFLFLAYNAPHWPLHAPKEDVERYVGKYSDGWHKMRMERYARMIEMGLVDPAWELTPQDSREWETMDDSLKGEMELRMAIYAAQVDRMDQNIGKLVGYLEQEGILDNTVIMFLNDNGACAEGGELGGGPAEYLGTEKGYFLSYGRAWANASNTPYRKYKHWVHEGGIATPFILHWPGGVPADLSGALVHEPGYLPDIMATCIDLAGTRYPEQYRENRILPLEGESLVPLFRGGRETIQRRPLFWEHEGNKAVRHGKYKLVQYWQEERTDHWELYDLELDRTEMDDLSSEMPEKVAELINLYEAWAERVHVLPWDSIKVLYAKKRNQ